MPRDILSDSLAVLRIVEHEDEESWPLEEKPACKQSTAKKTVNGSKVANDDCACYYNYGLRDSVASRQNDPLYQYKTSSLPAAATISHWDNLVCSAMQLSPEDIANQLSIHDLVCFKAIRPEELITCGWTKSNKAIVAPNVVAFTKRFNRVSFWTVQEILNGQAPKARAETLAHFIKVAKKLYDLNNLHSLFAVISALHSASIYRLTKTWSCLSKKDRQQFDRMAELFGEKDNWTALRKYMHSIRLPCIPHLGIFLTDLVYIDMAHPLHLGSPHRETKMGVVLETVQRYQTSEYDIKPVPHVANFLNSVRYIEELQKFLEDDQYKLSLKLEPPSPVGSCSGSKESVKEVSAQGTKPFTLSPSHRLGSGSLRIQGTYNQGKFVPTHRKSRSLGSKFRSASLPRNFHKVNFGVGIFGKGQNEDKDGKTPAGSVNLLDDTLLESPSSVVAEISESLPFSDPSTSEPFGCDFQSYVRRKTLLKEGRKISLSSWQRYWLQITANILIFYASKSFKGTCRTDFSKDKCKVLTLHAGWRAMWLESDASDGFQLLDRNAHTIYKFKTGSEATAKQWVSRINNVTDKMVQPLPANLMSFE
ncbi:ras-specific guanine nucleotide-releasing factor RalGPS1 isoform X1 [Pieris napi]|uniref:ras-specific guanine nucleotide-releasing factor RalGPS1 isoform X1 n=1 Tax=Pieris napi TaxID=78633 RepID=UPI001FBB1FB8|nr:ras-specific guanine nucleotide-releasing factor RalGPS1 isoform X1 [Pieris napi]XP_047524112.1 ras-specific guanine nucleotide-releasing factor RalGPS1 isoform X1 [Pieris napi]XP_047524113.1 ras-specific guanine nucleotide-releasing factor RalGPS1 isoform X1 [Pieris napi]